MGYHVRQLYVANADGTNVRTLTPTLDRDVRDPQWVGNGTICFLFEDHGVTKIGRVGVQGSGVTTVFDRVGGIEIGRPYTSGAFSVNRRGQFATVLGDSQRPGDVIVSNVGATRRLTTPNEDTLRGKNLSAAQPISARSSADGREIEAWIVRPPHFDPAQRYPLLLEIHGGPFAAYGPNFSAEAQSYAAAGYIVVYANPRGSTSYGDEFANLIHHNYPSQDFDDLMFVVDAVIAQEPVDPDRLFVTGDSDGGVLTAWVVGSTPRFRAATVQKPVINWTSWVLTADFSNFFAPYWFGEFPWEDGAQQRYWARSPLSRVGAETTPTAVIVGEEDVRTPTSEAEQYYQALRLRGVPTRLIHVPESPHDIAWRQRA